MNTILKQPGSHSGFVLFITLIMILIVSLLVMTNMHHLLLYQKTISRQEQRHEALSQIEAAVMQLARGNVSAPCILKADSMSEVIDLLSQKQGCMLQSDDYDYLYWVEELGDDACLVIHNENGEFASHHRRITIKRTGSGDSRLMLQIRYLSSIPLIHCKEEPIIVPEGVVSWRLLM